MKFASQMLGKVICVLWINVEADTRRIWEVEL